MAPEIADVKVGIGKFGSYILFREKYMSIRKPEDVLTMTLDNAVELIKNRREKVIGSAHCRIGEFFAAASVCLLFFSKWIVHSQIYNC